MNIKLSDKSLNEFKQFRRYLHENPELSFKEFNTTSLLKERLSKTNFEILDIDSEVGIIAHLFKDQSFKTVAIRADIDALPIQEMTDLEFKSKKDGLMHACGHDIHTIILLGFCEEINKLYKNLKINLVVIFQPAEEIMGGAKLILKELKRNNIKLDEIICYHTWPFIESGTIGYRSNEMMAGAMEFNVEIKASGGHAAHPHTTADPIFLSSNIINYFQGIVSRLNNPVKPLVITVGKISGGTKSNVISSNAEFSGTIRSFSKEMFDNVKEYMEQYISQLCKIYDADYEIEFGSFCPPVNNDRNTVSRFTKSNKHLNLIELDDPSMGSEDFAFYLEKIPGALFRIGTHDQELSGSNLSLHNPGITFSEDSIETGIIGLLNYALSYEKN